MKSFGVWSVVFLSSAGIVVACANGTTTTTGFLPEDAGPTKTDSGKTTSTSSSSTSTSGGKTSSSTSGSTGTPNGGACTGSGSISVAAKAGGGGAGCPQDVALSSADLDNEVGWKCASQVQGACTAAEITTIEGNFKNTNIKTYFDLANGVSAGCKECVVTNDTDSSWGPIVGTAADNGETGFVNFGACFGYVEGADCGKALQYEQFCYNIACNECTTTATERQKCVETAGSTGMCSNFGDATATACPDIQTTATKCNGVLDAVKILCGP
jgi:hypothetical protein